MRSSDLSIYIYIYLDPMIANLTTVYRSSPTNIENSSFMNIYACVSVCVRFKDSNQILKDFKTFVPHMRS